MTFRVGQKVVCVDESVTRNGLSPYVTKGNIYTVAHIRPSGCVNVAEALGNYLASRFRPIVERKTDISIFTSMLNPSKVDA